jgi:hypothetical protein
MSNLALPLLSARRSDAPGLENMFMPIYRDASAY